MSDLDGISMVKKGSHLIGADQHADELLSGIKDGREVIVSIRRPRNASHHRLLFAVLNKVVENTDQWASVDMLLDDLKLATGHAEVRVNFFTGERQIKPKSINFAAMSQDEFRPWFDKAIHLLATQALSIGPSALLDEILAIVGPGPQNPSRKGGS